MSAHTSKECRLCHRVGSRNFVPSGDYGQVCADDRACRRRVDRAERAAIAVTGNDARRYVTGSLRAIGDLMTWTEKCRARCPHEQGECHGARTALRRRFHRSRAALAGAVPAPTDEENDCG